MNRSLLAKIESVDCAILATILATKGHTYKKAGDKALFELDSAFPIYGNFGSQCVDQDIVKWAAEAFAAGAPRRVHVDVAGESDVHFGYGAYCGGELDILLEPVLEAHKEVYRRLTERLDRNESCFLVHDMKSGALALSEDAARGFEEPGSRFVERIDAPWRVCLFGATPLAERIVSILEDTDFVPRVFDWRETYLDKFKELCDTTLAAEDFSFDERCLVLVLSHNFLKDKQILSAALRRGCPYVGMLSSKTRRDKIYEELAEEGIQSETIARVRSPIGLDIKGRSDAEIAVSIVAELIGFKNR